ncbi:MAG: palindromic element RPE1 domain-containing protein [Holosporales bacterium]|jgi:RPE1 domain-containing protein|nr:palindromic element RPE1 domain-containing protein [Holosporales bacterium]
MREYDRLLSKPPESELLLGDTERRSGVYKGVHEHSSTGSTQQGADCGGGGRKSIAKERSLTTPSNTATECTPATGSMYERICERSNIRELCGVP